MYFEPVGFFNYTDLFYEIVAQGFLTLYSNSFVNACVLSLGHVCLRPHGPHQAPVHGIFGGVTGHQSELSCLPPGWHLPTLGSNQISLHAGRSLLSDPLEAPCECINYKIQ